jgi:hypothetical protein
LKLANKLCVDGVDGRIKVLELLAATQSLREVPPEHAGCFHADEQMVYAESVRGSIDFGDEGLDSRGVVLEAESLYGFRSIFKEEAGCNQLLR